MCLAAPGRQSTTKTLSLRLCLTIDCLYKIGMLVCESIDSGEVKSLELALPTVKLCLKRDGDDMMWHAKNLVGFLDVSPSLVQSPTKLFLYNSRFDEQGIHCLLNICEQLQHLLLDNCDTGDRSVLKIDMPNSKLSCLRLRCCRFEKIEFLCLPKLAKLHFESWYSLNIPCSFGFVPCLEELRLVCPVTRCQSALCLSELLNGNAKIKALTLDFQGQKVWMLPEGKKLCASFKNLSKMFIHGIFIKFGLLWTIALLEAAPSLKTFGIKVWHHACFAGREKAKKVFSKKTNPWRENNKLNGSRHSQLTRLEFGGFVRTKKHVDFIRVVMAYAPKLQTVLLEDKYPCGCSGAVNNNLIRSLKGSLFPKYKYEKDAILNQLGVGVSCSVQIIFK